MKLTISKSSLDAKIDVEIEAPYDQHLRTACELWQDVKKTIDDIFSLAEPAKEIEGG